MIEQEEWNLGPARASVVRVAGMVFIGLRGTVTPQAYERLHLHMAAEQAGDLQLMMGAPMHLAGTSISLTEAAARGTPEPSLWYPSRPVTLRVPAGRLKWANEHALLMSKSGLCRRALLLERLPSCLSARISAAPSRAY